MPLISYYLKAISLDSEFTEALNGYAQNLRLNVKDYNLAIIYYSKVIELNPLFECAYFRRGICKGMLNDLHGQLYDYSKHIEASKMEDMTIEEQREKFKDNVENEKNKQQPKKVKYSFKDF